jgi:hypothetical protein
MRVPARLRSPLARVGETLMAAAALVAAIDAALRVGATHPNNWPLYGAAVVGGVGFISTLFGISLQPRSVIEAGGTAQTPIHSTVESETEPSPIDGDGLSLHPSLRFPEILMRGPTSWLLDVDPERPELTLRVLVALPGVLPLMGGGGPEQVTQLRGEVRERLIKEALDASHLTSWLSALGDTWHWTDTPTWQVHGNSNVELTELRFVPEWPIQRLRRPFYARCGVATGQHVGPNTVHEPAIQIAFDLMINVLELDADRQPGSVRHQTTPPPAPAALGLEELASYLGHLWLTTDLAPGLARALLPGAEPRRGEAAVWVVAQQQLGRVVDLQQFERLPESTDASTGQAATAWPLPDSSASSPVASLIADLLGDMLERSGYRRLTPLIDKLKSGGWV